MVVGDFAQGTQVAIIGGGPGGYVAAIRAAQLGLEVTLVEKNLLGGVCLNWGCIPSKALAYVADLKRKIEHADSLGLVTSSVAVDFLRMMKWKDSVVEKLRKGVSSLLASHRIQVVPGRAYFTGDKSFTVEGPDAVQRFECQSAIVAVGSSPLRLPGIPYDGELVVDSSDALGLTSIPEAMVVVGAGAVGLEMGTVYAKLGTQVTIVDNSQTLLPTLDSQIGDVMERSLRGLGIRLVLGAKILGMRRSDSMGDLEYWADGKERTIRAEKILVAIGRSPNTMGIGLEKTGVKMDKRGFIEVDSRMQTSTSGVFAIGDAVSGPMLAHKASYQGKIAAEVIAGKPSAYEGVEVPSVIFSDPEIATVGLTQKEAEARGLQARVGSFPFKALGRAMTMEDRSHGFAKVVSDSLTGAVLGVHIVGPHASDIIAEGCLAVSSASHVEDLALTMHPHPTLPESIEEAAEQVEHRAIHIFGPTG